MWHVFDSDAVDKPLRPMANRFGGCFCLGSGPVLWVLFCFCCLLRCFRWRNASLAGGFAGRRFWCGCGFCFCCFNRFADSKDPLSLQFVFPAYSHVRTEPLARHRPHSRKKKTRRGSPSYIPRTNFRVAALLVHATRPMAPG